MYVPVMFESSRGPLTHPNFALSIGFHDLTQYVTSHSFLIRQPCRESSRIHTHTIHDFGDTDLLPHRQQPPTKLSATSDQFEVRAPFCFLLHLSSFPRIHLVLGHPILYVPSRVRGSLYSSQLLHLALLDFGLQFSISPDPYSLQWPTLTPLSI